MKAARARQDRSSPPRRRGRVVAVWLALLLFALLAWFWRPLNHYAVTATAYGARVACPCRFVAGRDLSDCRDDFAPGMTPVMLSESAEEKSVTATIPLLSSQTAAWREGQGCVIEKWRG